MTENMKHSLLASTQYYAADVETQLGSITACLLTDYVTINIVSGSY